MLQQKEAQTFPRGPLRVDTSIFIKKLMFSNIKMDPTIQNALKMIKCLYMTGSWGQSKNTLQSHRLLN